MSKSNSGRGRVQIHCDDGIVEQHHKESCDVNFIIRQYHKTGVLPSVGEPQFGDFSNIHDYHSSLNAVLAAQESFSLLPSQLRKRFDNDPAKFLSFCDDESNYNEMVELGLICAKADNADVQNKDNQAKPDTTVETL